MKIIEIVISPSGQTRVETRGFAGAACRQASEFLEKALGRSIGEQLTGEFYHHASEQQTLQEGT
jgi:hypothetical protein